MIMLLEKSLSVNNLLRSFCTAVQSILLVLVAVAFLLPAPAAAQASAVGPETSPAMVVAKDYSRVTVVIYMTSWCPYCKKAADYVRSLGANLVQYDIEAEPKRRDELRAKNGGSTSVPYIIIGETIIPGYNPEAIKRAVERAAAGS